MKWRNVMGVVVAAGVVASYASCSKKVEEPVGGELSAPPPAAAPVPEMPETPPADDGTQGGGQ